jgi:hypothetical protein
MSELGMKPVCSATARPKRGSALGSAIAIASPGLHDVAGDALSDPDRPAHDVAGLGAGRDDKFEPVGFPHDQRQRTGPGMEQGDGCFHDGLQEAVLGHAPEA